MNTMNTMNSDTNNDRPTPITDAATFRSWIWDAFKCDYAPGESAVPARVSADLERQLAEVTEQRDEARREAEAQRNSAHVAWAERGDTSGKELLPWEIASMKGGTHE